MSIRVRLCRSMPNYADPCQTVPIHVIYFKILISNHTVSNGATRGHTMTDCAEPCWIDTKSVRIGIMDYLCHGYASHKSGFMPRSAIIVYFDTGLEVIIYFYYVCDFIAFFSLASLVRKTSHELQISLRTSSEPYFNHESRIIILKLWFWGKSGINSRLKPQE